MTKKISEHGTLAERSARMHESQHGSTVGLRRPPAPDLDYGRPPVAIPDPTPVEARATEGVHVHVTTPAGVVPGLLAEWRRVAGGAWEGYVARLEHHDGRWVTVHSWLPATQLHRTHGTSTVAFANSENQL